MRFEKAFSKIQITIQNEANMKTIDQTKCQKKKKKKKKKKKLRLKI